MKQASGFKTKLPEVTDFLFFSFESNSLFFLTNPFGGHAKQSTLGILCNHHACGCGAHRPSMHYAGSELYESKTECQVKVV